MVSSCLHAWCILFEGHRKTETGVWGSFTSMWLLEVCALEVAFGCVRIIRVTQGTEAMEGAGYVVKQLAALWNESQGDVVESKILWGVLGPNSRTNFDSNSPLGPSPTPVDPVSCL